MRSILSFAAAGFLFWSASAFAAANGFGAAPGGADPFGAGAPGVFPPLAYEPWVKSAKVGDYAVLKYAAYTLRREVKAIQDEFVVVEENFDHNGKKNTYEKKYIRKEGLADSNEVDMKKTSSGKLKINGADVACDVWDGYIKGLRVMPNAANECYKALKYQKFLAIGMPFGGIVKELRAKDDGKGISFGNGKAGRVKNESETLELVFEVIEFGNTQAKK